MCPCGQGLGPSEGEDKFMGWRGRGLGKVGIKYCCLGSASRLLLLFLDRLREM